MKTKILRGGEMYSAPDVEILDVKIEGGFSVSDIDSAEVNNYGDF